MIQELTEKRTANSKTFGLDSGRRRLYVSIGDVHYKDNYADKAEPWKDIDLTIRDGKLATAPYELAIDCWQSRAFSRRNG